VIFVYDATMNIRCRDLCGTDAGNMMFNSVVCETIAKSFRGLAEFFWRDKGVSSLIMC
jgi:hypothetical protein